MKYVLDINSFSRIIDSPVVPANDNNGLDFVIGDTEINIKKPYIDRDAERMGNSIFIQHSSGLVIYMRIESTFFFLFFREEEKETFKSLEQTSPEAVKDFINQIWVGIVDYIETREEQNDVTGTAFNSFQAQFGMYGVPYDLERLFTFESKYGGESYSESFYLDVFDKTGLKTYSEEEGFLRSFIEFATANASGSTYAMWVINENLDKCPVVVFGDEGGIHLVARNTEEFIQLLSYDTEIMVTAESAYFYKSGIQEQERENRQEFLQWIKATLDLEPIETAEAAALLVKAAHDKHADSLYDFLIKYDVDVQEGFDTLKKYRSFEAFEKNFQGRKIPGELIMLYDFQRHHDNYAQYFYLRGYDRSILKMWNQQEEFLKAVIPFARATSFGALYALWDEGTGKELSDMPVLVLDEENDFNVVAENMIQFLRLLTYDIEPVLDGECYKLSNDRDNYTASNNIGPYIDWLKENFDAAPVDEPFIEIIDTAEEQFTEAFWYWRKELE